MVDWEYAYNYWRKAFVESSRGRFTKDDFDRWFRNGAKLVADSIGYFPDEAELASLGSKERFDVLMRLERVRPDRNRDWGFQLGVVV